MAGGKKRGVKPVSNIKYDKTHEDLYLVCEYYQTLASQYIKMNIISFLNYSHFSPCFTGTKIGEQYFGRFLVKLDNGKLEASAVMQGRSHKYE